MNESREGSDQAEGQEGAGARAEDFELDEIESEQIMGGVPSSLLWVGSRSSV